MINSDFSRRGFIKQNFLTGSAMMLLGGLGSCADTNSSNYETTSREKIGNLNLDQLRKQYKASLFEKFLPNMNSFVIDHEFGGFMCSVDIRSGKKLSTNKRAWYEGRGIWVYSYLFNNFGKDPKFLEVARKSKNFILKHRPKDNSFWVSSFSREGAPLSGPGDIYGNLFISEGLAEYAKASGEKQYLDLAKKIMFQALERYDQPDYDNPISYGPPSAPRIKGPRVLGHWMVFLRSATQFLEQEADPDVEKLAGRCVEAIMEHHLNPEHELLNEGLNHDLSLPDNEWAQFAYLGHGIETLWMVMAEAVRLKDHSLFNRTTELFKRHISVAQDFIYGGYFRSLDHVNNYIWKLDKVLWLQEEILIGTMMMIEHMADDEWAREKFSETYAYIHDKYVHQELAFVVPSGDQKMVNYQVKRAEHYHHPRHLMLNLLALERMVQRNGKVSGAFG